MAYNIPVVVLYLVVVGHEFDKFPGACLLLRLPHSHLGWRVLLRLLVLLILLLGGLQLGPNHVGLLFDVDNSVCDCVETDGGVIG